MGYLLDRYIMATGECEKPRHGPPCMLDTWMCPWSSEDPLLRLSLMKVPRRRGIGLPPHNLPQDALPQDARGSSMR